MPSTNIEKPKLAIVYAYFLTIGGLLGLLMFLAMFLAGSSLDWLRVEISPVVLAITIFIVSCLGLVTGSGLLGRKKYGWMLSQFLFIYLLIKTFYALLLITFLYYQNITPPTHWGLSFLKFFLLISVLGFLLIYFNQQGALKYYNMEKEEAYRIYLLSFLTSLIIIFLNVFLNN